MYKRFEKIEKDDDGNLYVPWFEKVRFYFNNADLQNSDLQNPVFQAQFAHHQSPRNRRGTQDNDRRIEIEYPVRQNICTKTLQYVECLRAEMSANSNELFDLAENLSELMKFFKTE